MTMAFILCLFCGFKNQWQVEQCALCKKTSLVKQTGRPGLLLSDSFSLRQRYILKRLVGKGGMGTVYEAVDMLRACRVAIKEMSQNGINPQTMLERYKTFSQEAHLQGSLQHPHIPTIYDHFSEAGRWYLVMDFIEGVTLNDYLKSFSTGSLPLVQVLIIGVQLCSVLDYLHVRRPSIIFHDLKPSNIMIASDGRLFLIDFGLARYAEADQLSTVMGFGSRGYAAPEQYLRKPTTPRSDIYSLGVILYQLLTGDNPVKRPFRFSFVRLQNCTIPGEIMRLVKEMTAFHEYKRPASVALVKRVLQGFIPYEGG